MHDAQEAALLATDVTAAWLANPNTRANAEGAAALLRAVYVSISELAAPIEQAGPAATPPTHTPAVSVRKSLASRDHIVSMIDGKPYRALRRHLTAKGLTPDQYRERYSLAADYPMVAQGYSEARSAMAKRTGLGRKPAAAGQANAEPEPAAAPTARKRLGLFAAKQAAKDHLAG